MTQVMLRFYSEEVQQKIISHLASKLHIEKNAKIWLWCQTCELPLTPVNGRNHKMTQAKHLLQCWPLTCGVC